MEDCDQSKVFVGGISWETTEDVLRDHFGSYGRVVGSVIAKDRATGSPRGFAFVSFSDASALDKVLLDTHTILGRTVEVKKAVPRSEQNQNQQEQSRGLNRNSRTNDTRNNNNLRTKKIFVGGLSANLTEEDFKIYFEKFGRITDVVVMHDNVTHRPRGFGFITFDSEDSVEEVMQKNFHELGGKLVEVKRAVPKEVSGGSTSSNGYSSAQNRDSNVSRNFYPPYRPRYEMVPSYGPIPAYGIGTYPYGGGVFAPVGGYGGMEYGFSQVSPRLPWSGPTMVAVRGNPLAYGAVYPAYGHGLMGGMVGPVPNGVVSPLSGGNERVYSLADAGSNGVLRQLGGGSEGVTQDVDNNSLGASGDRNEDKSGVVGGNMS